MTLVPVSSSWIVEDGFARPLGAKSTRPRGRPPKVIGIETREVLAERGTARREHAKQRHNIQYADRLAAGLCVRCGVQPHEPDYTTCRRCLLERAL